MLVFSDVLQITPAHDQDDFKAGKRHSLEFIVIFTDDGKINDNGGAEFSGMPRFEAREAVKEALKKKVRSFHLIIFSIKLNSCLILKL